MRLAPPFRRTGLIVVLSVAAGLLSHGCGSGGPKPDSLPPQTLSPLPPPDSGESAAVAPSEPVTEPVRVEERAEAPAEPSTEAEEDSPRRPAVIEVGESEKYIENEENMLARVREASRRETERRKEARAPVVVITDQNLSEMAEGGKVTIVTEPPANAASGAEQLLEERQDEERYWRQGARELRQRWRHAWDETERLEAQAADLRRQFYLEDDPFVRDGQIKPEWDHVLEELDEARTEVEAAQRELERFLEEGRRAGALPGWLREGVELEPVEEQEPELPEADPREPVILEEPPR